jgi:hypothetical protein
LAVVGGTFLAAAPAIAAPVDLHPPELQFPENAELEVQADEVSHDERAHTMRAAGHLVITYGAATATADELVFDTEARRGALRGHVTLTGPTFDLTAEAAQFDLLARHAELDHFKGRWANRAQLAGEQLVIEENVITLKEGYITPCMAPEPDLSLGARTLRYYPNASLLNLAAEGVSLRVWDQTVLVVPSFSSTVGKEKEPWRSDFLPAFGFDAYRGFLTSTRLDFSLGENSRGTIPITFSTGRGWAVGMEHFLAVGPGELQNTVMVETPWAVSRGGVRVLNAYRFSTRDGSRWDIAADYRADLNGLPVSRLPDVSWTPPSLWWRGVGTLTNEVRAGYLWEESTDVKSPRLRWSAPFTSVIWGPLPSYQTWVNGNAFLSRYADSQFYGGSLAWMHREPILEDLAFNQALEVQRVSGETPFVHDRMYDTDRIRLGLDKGWGPRLSTSLSASWVRLKQQGDLSIEDVAVTAIYRWNCFSVTLALHPLIYGVDTRFQLLNF